MDKKKVVVFTGAGVSAESGIQTFRDSDNGLWYNYNVDEVATKEGWKKDKAKVLEFHNMLRSKTHSIKPNYAHELIADLQEDFDVTVVTQNVDDLHEKAGSRRILHLHGELMKCESTLDPSLIYDCRGSIDIGDKCEKGSQLRPHTVLFGEWPNNVEEASLDLIEADYVIIVGCSFQIGYTIEMIMRIPLNTKIYYIDPNPVSYFNGMDITYIKEKATIGMKEVYNLISF